MRAGKRERERERESESEREQKKKAGGTSGHKKTTPDHGRSTNGSVSESRRSSVVGSGGPTGAAEEARVDDIGRRDIDGE
jgi:hypothetical protein